MMSAEELTDEENQSHLDPEEIQETGHDLKYAMEFLYAEHCAALLLLRSCWA